MPLNELLTLRLAVPLEYAQVSLGECGDWEVLLGKLRPGIEGMESAVLFDRRAFIADDPFSGPKALPGPGVIRAAGISERKTRDSCGRGGSFREGPEGQDGPDRDSPLLIQAGSYAFMQTRAATGSQLAQALERFARDVWWEKLAVREEWYLRMVAEDGKLAVQILAALEPGTS